MTAPSPSPKVESGLKEQIERDSAAFAALALEVQQNAKAELASIGTNLGLTFATPVESGVVERVRREIYFQEQVPRGMCGTVLLEDLRALLALATGKDEVTEAMIEAGRKVVAWSDNVSDGEYRAIFKAMRSAQLG